ncbi:GH1 family beta-glucosidase [Streptomyces stelliscabiei]|uniref:GH1 family beta-glucosidase n=1 Tax=Streptomyces stelliscabiei TaxID=146820 RepID=UPI0029B265BE|nr:GH1 family beta-glucosidase [Streptomyces stelliscabiei]MDX2550250.1 GH1 family beta-glucosidase [Streptomyces stelliscabiei]MDX2610451.1 GH1 family beta-glucosidase [Streptomyces stelliscabiei]MDX2635460.1 GH1 family beta-glucosidase [Streptomyces stelliscabiei]MDX2665733.1 GH1 family beta-glucosidase [Streptomyces stelliscabiei]MDX2715043.1 GH1 family beta-glucosidase [Streptomyces stelliscabiei]
MATNPTNPIPQFPADFLWGVSTSAHQIEGAAAEREPSVWDAFTAEAGHVKDGSTAEVACDHFHRYPQDVALLRDLGVGAYRFSVSWTRVNSPGGLDFYDRLVDELAGAGVRPVPTLFHWDLPSSLEEAGGWLNRDTAERFAEYASVVAARLRDRVTKWITINEPAEHTLLGHALGTHAPGKQLMFDALPAAHHQLLGHGLAVRALRAAGVTDIGIANSHGPTWAASQEQADVEAAGFYDLLLNRLFAEPIILGEYPEGIGELMPGTDISADLKVISEPLDWYGVNYYAPTRVGAPEGADIEFGGITIPAELPLTVKEIEGAPTTDFGWPVVPGGLTELLTTFRERYGDRLPPVVITENGCSYEGVDDQERIAYLDGHVRALHEATEAGVDVRGYFVWSLLDNFEWAEGYARRFGLVHVDFETLERTPKASYAWYRDLLRAQGGR